MSSIPPVSGAPSSSSSNPAPPAHTMSRLQLNQINANMNVDSIKGIIIYLIIVLLVLCSVYLFLLNPKIQIIQNAKHVYNSSIEKINTTYGKAKKDAETAAQEAKETWEKNITNTYKIIIESIFVLLHIIVIFLYKQNIIRDTGQIWIGTWIGKYQFMFHLLLFAGMIFEYFSNQLDNFLKNIFNSIDETLEKNTKDDTVHHKTLATILTAGITLGSFVSIFLFKWFDTKIITIAILSFLCLFMVLFNVPGFDSEIYILVLFFLANIPFVTMVVNRLQEKDKSKQNVIYIPLLISFFMLCIFLLALMGGIDVSNNKNLFFIMLFIGITLLFYMKSLDNSVYKTFVSLIGIILLFIVTLHYVLTSQHWILYVLGYALILFYFFKKIQPSTIIDTTLKSLTAITPREKIVLAVEILFIFIYLYIRPILKTSYTSNGQLVLNEPIHLHEYKDIKIDKNIKYDYGLSFWINLQSMNPSSSPKANEFTPVFNYGDDKVLVTYNNTKNTMRIEIKEESNKKRIVDNITPLSLQKWNHIVINYINGKCDIFINGELHQSVSEIIPIQEQTKSIGIGDSEGIQGQICNIIIFNQQLSHSKIKQLYTDFVDKTPPIF